MGEQGFGARTNGFPAFPPAIAGTSDRGSAAAWLDLETRATEDLLVGLAARYERYEGSIGGSLDGKLTGRWQAGRQVALRGSVGTGFRAPTLGQASVRNESTYSQTLPDGSIDLVENATLPVEELPAGAFPDARPLQPETAFQVGAGVVLAFGDLELTLDYYHISVKDRITLTSESDWPAEDADGNPVPNPLGYEYVRWFSNDFDTTTQGVDLVALHPLQHSLGESLLTLAANFNSTRVDRAGRFVNDMRIHQLEKALPRSRFTFSASHQLGSWRILLPRLRYYGGFVEYAAGVFLTEASARMLVDLEIERDFGNGLRLAAGVDNLLDTYPSSINPDATRFLGSLWPETSPYGYNGGFYRIRAIYQF